MNNMALGRYIPYNTFIHRLDPRAKILAMFGLLVVVFLPIGFIGYTALGIFILGLLLLTKIKISMIYKSLKPMWIMMLFLFIINLFMIQTGFVLFTIPLVNFPVYSDAIFNTLFIVVRLAFMISITTILTVSTKPLELTYGLEYLFTPLKIIKFPAHEISMMISIALRFIPTLLEETQRIMKAQASRGVDLSDGKFKEKIIGIVSLIIPLFFSSFQRAEDLANAMEARGYDPSGKRTRYRQLKFTFRDLICFFVVLGLLAGAIYLTINPIDINALKSLIGL